MVTKLHRHIPHVSRMCPIDFRVKRSGQGHSAGISENCFKCITAFPLHLWSHNFTYRLFMSQGCALLISRSKGQGHSTLISHFCQYQIFETLHFSGVSLCYRPALSKCISQSKRVNGAHQPITHEFGREPIYSHELYVFIYSLRYKYAITK